MIFRDFKFQVILRLTLLTVLSYGVLYYAFFEINYIRVFFFGLFSVLVLISLFYYVNKTNKLTSSFLDAIIHNDFTVKYPLESSNKTIRELFLKFNEVNNKFLKTSQHQADQYQYLLAMINQLKVAVVAFDGRERVHLTNKSYEELIQEKNSINLKPLSDISNDLYKTMVAMKPNEQMVVKTIVKGSLHQFSLSASYFKLRDKEYKLVSLQDIHAELDQNEMQAWQKLIRVLTHEIMNSISPVVSLSGSLEKILQNTDQQNITSNKETLLEGMDAIKVRGQGLMNFTRAYRKLTRIPPPHLQKVGIQKLSKQVETLFRENLKDTSIQFHIEMDSKDDLLIDLDLIQQVIINLLKNAKEAVDPKIGKINMTFNHTDNGPQIIISDNGTGIPESIQDQIFIPFYTTKEDGSGIGLSLAKQIIQLHGGKLEFKSHKNGTSFFIKL